MRMQQNHTEHPCHIVVGAMSTALRGQRLLRAAGIPAEPVKTDTTAKEGCRYGLSLPCLWLHRAEGILSEAGLLRGHTE